jgi:hypothetical protein
MQRPQKITFGEMRESDVRGVLIYCSDYHCSHYITANADPWPDDITASVSVTATIRINDRQHGQA